MVASRIGLLVGASGQPSHRRNCLAPNCYTAFPRPSLLPLHSFALFFAAALVLAVTPGPGIFYVLTRTLAGGRRDGFLSAGGTLLGGMFHVFAAALGISAILAASAVAFAAIKYAGAAYLVYLGVRMIRSRDLHPDLADAPMLKPAGTFRQGIATEVLNPKTALFFLSFIPQFISRTGSRFRPVPCPGNDFGDLEHFGGRRGGISGGGTGRPA